MEPIPSPRPQKLSMLRKMIAKHMMGSLSTTAQLTYFAHADVTGLLAQRQAWKTAGEAIGIEDCIIAALSAILNDFPAFNATLEEGEIHLHAAHNISVALATPSGLLSPVLHGAEDLPLRAIAERRRDLVTRGLAGKLKVTEMKGGTFTISNLGLTRVTHFTPILNVPQVALLGLGRIEQRCAPSKDGIETRSMIGLSLTADHQWLDGAPCGDFLTALCERLEQFDIAL